LGKVTVAPIFEHFFRVGPMVPGWDRLLSDLSPRTVFTTTGTGGGPMAMEILAIREFIKSTSRAGGWEWLCRRKFNRWSGTTCSMMIKKPRIPRFVPLIIRRKKTTHL